MQYQKLAALKNELTKQTQYQKKAMRTSSNLNIFKPISNFICVIQCLNYLKKK